jgi:hypothetical protein
VATEEVGEAAVLDEENFRKLIDYLDRSLRDRN